MATKRMEMKMEQNYLFHTDKLHYKPKNFLDK